MQSVCPTNERVIYRLNKWISEYSQVAQSQSSSPIIAVMYGQCIEVMLTVIIPPRRDVKQRAVTRLVFVER